MTNLCPGLTDPKDYAEEYVDDDGVESGLVIQCRTGYAGVPRRVCAGVGSECRAEVFVFGCWEQETKWMGQIDGRVWNMDVLYLYFLYTQMKKWNVHIIIHKSNRHTVLCRPTHGISQPCSCCWSWSWWCRAVGRHSIWAVSELFLAALPCWKLGESPETSECLKVKRHFLNSWFYLSTLVMLQRFSPDPTVTVASFSALKEDFPRL